MGNNRRGQWIIVVSLINSIIILCSEESCCIRRCRFYFIHCAKVNMIIVEYLCDFPDCESRINIKTCYFECLGPDGAVIVTIRFVIDFEEELSSVNSIEIIGDGIWIS